jgi:energy-coupling factor transport system ATP-binding protein
MGKGTILLDAPIREAYHQTELLRSTFLDPPQAVRLAQHLGRHSGHVLKLLTPREVAACLDSGSQRKDKRREPDEIPSS